MYEGILQQQFKQMKLDSKPTVSSLISNGRRRLVYVYEDGRQMIEEYDLKTHDVLMRKIKKPETFKQTKWEFEIGESLDNSTEQVTLMKAYNNPIFVRKDVLQAFQWRIRNLPYPIETYIFQVDPVKQQLVIKTTNKKYYKRFDIPDLKRANIKLDKSNISHQHKNETLIIAYRKPEPILEKEIKIRKQFQKMNAKKPKEGDIECTTQ